MEVRTALFIIELLCLLTSGETQSREIYPPDASVSNPLYFGLMTSNGGRIKSSGVVHAIQIALDLVNNNSLLGDYTLHYVLYDTQVRSFLYSFSHGILYIVTNVPNAVITSKVLKQLA